MYNVDTGMVPSYIQYLIPPLVSEISDDYSLRNNRNHCLYRAPDRPFLEAERTTQDGGPLNTGKVGVSLYPL